MNSAPARRLMNTPQWRMLLCGDRDRIASAVAQINARSQADEYAALLLIIRRRHARKTVLPLMPFTLPYSERERRSALTALGLLRGAMGRELGTALDPRATHFDRHRAHEGLARRRDRRAAGPLIDALIEGHALEDWQCIPTLGVLGDIRAADALLCYVGIVGDSGGDREPDLGVDIGKALKNLNARDAFDIARAALDSPLAHRRATAAMVVAGWGDESLGSLLLPLLDDPESRVRACAITALGDLKVVAAMDALRSGQYDSDAEVRIAAERAYQQISTAYAHRTVKAGRITRSEQGG